jgi:putative hydrolase of the HAD superfamily
VKYRGKMPFEYILFDLDETLYPKETGVMKAIVGRMLDYMTQKVGIPPDDAMSKKYDYNQRYGTVLRGLLEEYRINPDDFLAFVHDINPKEFLVPSPPLERMLHEIPLRKVIFTNADAAHSERVLDALRVRAHFEAIIDIKTLNYENKPRPQAYQQALGLLQTSGERCILVDDMPRNLIPAKNLGMTTILINGDKPNIAIDYAVPTIFHVERILKGILPLERF